MTCAPMLFVGWMWPPVHPFGARSHSRVTDYRRGSKWQQRRVAMHLQTHKARAITAVESVYEDDIDGLMRHNRWTAARDEAEETGIGKALGSASVYGDVDLHLFLRGLAAAGVRESDAIVDIGSGYGRAVLVAACAYDGEGDVRARSVTGIEILPMLHQYGIEKAELLRQKWPTMTQVRFVLGDYRNNAEAKQELCDADCVFAFATTWVDDDGCVPDLEVKLSKHLKPGARVVLVDAALRTATPIAGKQFVLMTSFDDANTATEESAVNVYLVEQTAA